MNFLKIKTCWSNAELALFKLCIVSVGLLIGAYLPDLIMSIFIPVALFFVISTTWVLYLWLKKMNNREE